MSNKKFLIMIGSLAFSFGILSVGYGFWTDKLDVEGKADVKFSVNVTDDVLEEETISPEAIELVVNPELDSTGGNEEASSPPQPESQQADIPEIPDPVITPPPAEDPVLPENPAPVVNDPQTPEPGEPAAAPEPEPDPDPDPSVTPAQDPEPQPEESDPPADSSGTNDGNTGTP